MHYSKRPISRIRRPMWLKFFFLISRHVYHCLLTTNCINAFVCAMTTTPLTVTSVVEWCFVSCAQTCTMLLLALSPHTVSLLRPFTEILIKTNSSSSLDLSVFYLQCWLQSFQLSYSGFYCILLESCLSLQICINSYSIKMLILISCKIDGLCFAKYMFAMGTFVAYVLFDKELWDWKENVIILMQMKLLYFT